MKSWPLVALAAVTVASAVSAGEHRIGEHTFTLPDGFTIERVAGPNLVPRPVSASFDTKGRLYVTDSSGSNLPPAEQLKNPGGRILRLVDDDGEGTFDRAEVFAEHVMFPQGCLWHDGSVYVAGPPSIWKFTDTDGDGVADKREEWYQGKVLTGCANDVHGPYLGPEGMIYWTKGAFARLDLKDGHGRPIQDRCAHLFRAHPDGTGLESIMSGGMDNPVEVAFTVTGEPIVIGTFFDLSQPGRRDGMIHAVYGGVFGKMNDVVDEPVVVRTGDLLPAMTQFGPAAACALTRYDGDAFGPEYRGNLFGTLFNLHKVTRDIVTAQGATFRTQDSDFLVSDQIDFHPTDVLEDADGSLLIVDTGGWYKLCCPSSQLAKADVLGGVYRIRRDSREHAPLDAAGRTSGYARLTAPPPLDEDSAVVQLKRLALAANKDSAVRLRDALTHHLSTAGTSSASAQVVRVAAEGLGRIGDRGALPLLFRAVREAGGSDRFLEHSLLYAILEIGDAGGIKPFLESEDPLVRRAALLALEQIGDHTLRARDVIPWLTAESAPLHGAARWIASRHPEWSGELSGQFRDRLTGAATPPAEKERWERLLSLLTRNEDGQVFVAEAAGDARYRKETRVAALDAMASAGLKQPPPSWIRAIVASIKSTSETARASSSAGGTEMGSEVLAAAIRAARTLPPAKGTSADLVSALHDLAHADGRDAVLRVEALAALPQGSEVDDAEWSQLRAALQPEQPPRERLLAAATVAKLKLTSSQFQHLFDLVAAAGPLELPRILPVFSTVSDEALGRNLVAALRRSKALKAVTPEELHSSLARLPAGLREEADQLRASVASDASQERAHLETLLADIRGLDGQVRRGQALFNSAKAACSSCHRIGYLGGNVGPDLTSIGTARTETDLLEAVVYPSASFVRSFEPWIADCKDGETYSGVLKRETPEEIVLATGPGAEVRVPRSNLSELRPGAVSVMPAGLEDQLSHQDLADLLSFLKNTKWGAN